MVKAGDIMTTSTVNLNIRMDKNLKEDLDALCKELGLTTSTAINIFAKAMVRKQALPFKLSLHNENKKTLKVMKNIEEGKNLSRKFTSVEELMEDLNA